MMVGDEAYEELANRLGRDKLNAFAVDRNIPKADPGWTGAVQMLPLLDALDERIERIQAIMDSLPNAIRGAASESIHGLANAIADTSIARIETGGIAAIKSAVAGEITGTLLPALETVTEHHRTAIAATAADLNERAIKFGNGAQSAVERLSSTADLAAQAVRSHGALIYHHHLRGWMQTGLAALGFAIISAFASHAFASHQCASNIERAHAYGSSAKLHALQRTYCP